MDEAKAKARYIATSKPEMLGVIGDESHLYTNFGPDIRVFDSSNWLGRPQFEIQRRQKNGDWVAFEVFYEKDKALVRAKQIQADPAIK